MEDSHFSRLSPELRNAIYNLALFERRPVAVSKNFSVEPPLLRVCKQIRQEAELIFYAINDFNAVLALEKDVIEDKLLIHWLHACSKSKLELINSLTIRVEAPGYDFRAATAGSCDSRRSFSETPVGTSLRKCSFGKRSFEQVVRFTMNGQGDDLSADEFMRLPDSRRRKMHFCALLMMLETAYGVNVETLMDEAGKQMLMELQQKLREERQKNTTAGNVIAADLGSLSAL
ncbi:hypothetical protein LTR37_019333 [Vermiconidia calcicola]|uniref:Uncharacterized protein n=1 Tax=Vermiconidia calcicola TaxID=1690605 RepID=A0ACC3MGB4_9PEZI|nr:hypothetical protein LTR37_019333 [Vermiconidia calcicola]